MTLLCCKSSNIHGTILFNGRTIFKTLALEQSTKKWPFSAGGGDGGDRPDPPLGYGPVNTQCNIVTATVAATIATTLQRSFAAMIPPCIQYRMCLLLSILMLPTHLHGIRLQRQL